jgi:ATP-dependent DNA helicase PIF1
MTPEPPITLSQLNTKQRMAAEQIAGGQNTMITGGAGTGKSVLLRYLLTQYPDMPVTASTGIAALNVNGCTLHSWAGLGMGNTTADEIATKLNKKKNSVWYAMKKVKRLAIDEISMVDAETLDKVDRVLQLVRGHAGPFGGIQMIVFGDFLQLPPVGEQGKAVRFAFEAQSWVRAQFKVFMLTEVMRQKDREFADILSRVRIGDTSEDVRNVLRPRINAVDEFPDTTPVTLATHNEIADRINSDALAALKTDEVTWQSTDWADGDYSRANLEKNCIALKTLVLKVGAQVMLLRNIDPEAGLVNGSLGELVEVKKGTYGQQIPVVKFGNGIVREIEKQEWSIQRNREVLASRQQIPLRLSYAISIHKSQGLSLDKVRVHLKNCFADGQAYVAMSRARTLPGLFIADITGKSIRANPVALEFYRQHAA